MLNTSFFSNTECYNPTYMPWLTVMPFWHSLQQSERRHLTWEIVQIRLACDQALGRTLITSHCRVGSPQRAVPFLGSLWRAAPIPRQVALGCVKKLIMSLWASQRVNQEAEFLPGTIPPLFLLWVSALISGWSTFSDRLWPESLSQTFSLSSFLVTLCITSEGSRTM